MSATPSAVRQSIEARVLTTTLTSGDTLTLSTRSYLDFRGTNLSPEHLRYAVGLLSTEPVGEQRMRSGTSDTIVTSDVRVIVAFKLGAHNGMRDNTFDDALTVAHDIRLHLNVRDGTFPLTFSPTWRRTEQSNLGPAGWVAIEHFYSVLHPLAM